MPDNLNLLLIYALPMLAVWFGYAWMRRRRHRRAFQKLQASREAGLTEPASLHPWIDPARCLGCGSCVDACPEGEILGLVDGKSKLVDPTSCIGHGACRDACPQDAITLVLGTETRGVEIPQLNSDFQTNVPGIYVAGELGGMGLIRNAIIQGREAMDEIADSLDGKPIGDFDVIVVGAGPAGIAASLRARERGLRGLTIEQDTLGGTVAHYPRGKIVMTVPVELPLYGTVSFRETRKEELLKLWNQVVAKTNLEIQFQVRLEAIEASSGAFTVETSAGRHTASRVLLAIGRRGTPRKLGVPGEELSKVVYRLTAPEQYRGQRVLVVGGGDSAIEAAVSLATEPGTEVALCYRSDAFSRAKLKNRERVEAAAAKAQLQLLLASQVSSIGASSVMLETPNGPKEIANDAVIVCAGGILPTPLLRAAGIEIVTRHGEA
jgi:thioredoxin reductase (NADPH)